MADKKGFDGDSPKPEYPPPYPEEKPQLYPQSPEQYHELGFYSQPTGPGGPVVQAPSAPNVVVVSQQTPVGPRPTAANCPNCNKKVRTRTETEANSKTHLIALLLCVFGCWPCCCIPYCVDSCQTINHYCSNCNAFLGAYQS